MPFRLMYCFSDFLYFIFFYIIKYRKKVVLLNLHNSFPEKNEKEILLINIEIKKTKNNFNIEGIAYPEKIKYC